MVYKVQVITAARETMSAGATVIFYIGLHGGRYHCTPEAISPLYAICMLVYKV